MPSYTVIILVQLLTLLIVGSTNGFSFPSRNLIQHATHFDATSSSMSTIRSTVTKLQMVDKPKATLDENTTWRLRFALNGVPTTKGRTVGELFNVDVQFVLEEGFEPPQGEVKQILKQKTEDENSNDNVRYLKVTSGRWKLSEDPEDRKDGLWVWGLFKEPLYPFLLLQLETEEYQLPGSDGNSIKPLTLYAQINHKRDKETGEVELSAATLNLREIETINADPFGASKVR